jgi:hypothetical protein
MKFDKQLERFIELRVQGKSFDEIAKDLKTSKNTLLDWSKKFQVRATIEAEKALKINNLIKSFEMDRESRLKSYLEFSKKVNDELLTRDLSQIPTEKLLTIAVTSVQRVFSVTGNSIQIGVNDSFMVAGEDKDGYFSFSLDE